MMGKPLSSRVHMADSLKVPEAEDLTSRQDLSPAFPVLIVLAYFTFKGTSPSDRP